MNTHGGKRPYAGRPLKTTPPKDSLTLSLRLSADDLTRFKQAQLPGESLAQTAKRLLLQSLSPTSSESPPSKRPPP